MPTEDMADEEANTTSMTTDSTRASINDEYEDADVDTNVDNDDNDDNDNIDIGDDYEDNINIGDDDDDTDVQVSSKAKVASKATIASNIGGKRAQARKKMMMEEKKRKMEEKKKPSPMDDPKKKPMETPKRDDVASPAKIGDSLSEDSSCKKKKLCVVPKGPRVTLAGLNRKSSNTRVFMLHWHINPSKCHKQGKLPEFVFPKESCLEFFQIKPEKHDIGDRQRIGNPDKIVILTIALRETYSNYPYPLAVFPVIGDSGKSGILRGNHYVSSSRGIDRRAMILIHPGDRNYPQDKSAVRYVLPKEFVGMNLHHWKDVCEPVIRQDNTIAHAYPSTSEDYVYYDIDGDPTMFNRVMKPHLRDAVGVKEETLVVQKVPLKDETTGKHRVARCLLLPKEGVKNFFDVFQKTQQETDICVNPFNIKWQVDRADLPPGGIGSPANLVETRADGTTSNHFWEKDYFASATIAIQFVLAEKVSDYVDRVSSNASASSSTPSSNGAPASSTTVEKTH